MLRTSALPRKVSAEPVATMRPSTRTYALEDTASARSTSCSTRSTLTPADVIDSIDLEHLVDHDRREAERWFVHDQQLGAGHQRPADGEHLLLAAAEPAG